MLGIGVDKLNHAYLLLGEVGYIRPALFEHLGTMGIQMTGNPDLHLYEDEMFGIGEARLLRDRALGKAFGEKKVFILAPLRFTAEAQNALLKTLEEPTENTHFFIISRDEGSIIPTLRSRMQTVRLHRLDIGQKNTEVFSAENLPDSRTDALRDVFSPQHLTSEAESFLALSLKDRLEFAKDFAEKEKSLPIFLDQLLTALKSKGVNSSMKRAYNVSLFAGDRSASARLVLEHLALVL